MNPLLTAALGSILRWALAILAGYLVKKGIWSDSEAATYVTAGALGLLTLGWTLWERYKARVKLLTALTLPEGSTENELKDHMKSATVKPSILTPPDSVPTPATPPPNP